MNEQKTIGEHRFDWSAFEYDGTPPKYSKDNPNRQGQCKPTTIFRKDLDCEADKPPRVTPLPSLEATPEDLMIYDAISANHLREAKRFLDLFNYYQVSSVWELVEAQERHIKKLQEKLNPFLDQHTHEITREG